MQITYCHIGTKQANKHTERKKKRTEEKNKETGYECVMVFYAPFVRLFDQNKLFIHFEMSSSRLKLMINISLIHETFIKKISQRETLTVLLRFFFSEY